MPDGSGSVVKPHPPIHGVRGKFLEPVGQRRILKFDAVNMGRV